MVDLIANSLTNTRLLAMIFAAIAAVATVLTLAMPLLATDSLARRMKSVAIEREKIRQRERERLARGEKVSLRQVAEAVHAADRRAVQSEPSSSARRRRARSWCRRDIAVRRLTSRSCSSGWSCRS